MNIKVIIGYASHGDNLRFLVQQNQPEYRIFKAIADVTTRD